MCSRHLIFGLVFTFTIFKPLLESYAMSSIRKSHYRLNQTNMHFKEVVLATASLALFPVGNLTLPREEVKFTLTPSRMKKDSLEVSRASLEHHFLYG